MRLKYKIGIFLGFLITLITYSFVQSGLMWQLSEHLSEFYDINQTAVFVIFGCLALTLVFGCWTLAIVCLFADLAEV